MMFEDRELETFLRQVRPRPPRPLGRVRRRRPSPWLALAAAVLAVAALGIWRGRAPRPAPQLGFARPTRPTVGELNAALRAGTLEQVLDRMAPAVLPDPTESGGALRVLGDVARDLGQDKLRRRSK